MLSAADLLPYEYEDAVLFSNRILAVTNQGTYYVWDTSDDIHPLSQFICFESFRFISFKFKFRGAVGPRGVSRRSGDVWFHAFERRRGNHGWLW